MINVLRVYYGVGNRSFYKFIKFVRIEGAEKLWLFIVLLGCALQKLFESSYVTEPRMPTVSLIPLCM